MAVIKANTADGGTAGAVVTVANSGGASGNAWGNVTANVWTYTTEQTVKGGRAYKGVQAGGASALLQMDFTSSLTTHYGRVYVYLTAFAASEHPMVRGYVGSFVDAWRIGINATGQLRIRDASGTLLTTTTSTITTGAWWRLEWRVVNGTGTSGQLQVKAFLGDATTESFSYTNNACNTAATTDHIHFGPSLATPTVPTLYLDEISTDSAAYPGPANIVNQAPTANAGNDQNVIEGSIVTLDGTGSTDTDGTISNYAWQQTSGTSVTLSSASAAQPTFTAPAAPATLVFQLTVTDNSSATATDSVTITVDSTLFRYSKAEGGSNGTVVTPGNSATSGDAWNTVSGTNAITYSNVNVARGSLGYRIAQQSAETATLTWSFTSQTEMYGRCYMYFTGFGSITQVILRSFGTDGTSESFRADLLTNGQVRLRDAATGILATSISPVQTGVWYRFEWHVICSATTGTLDFRMYVADQSTPWWSYSNTACNTFTHIGVAQFGPGFTTVVLPTMFTDELALNLNGWIGSAAGTPLNSPPVANAGSDQSVSGGVVVTLNGSASTDVDGTISSYAWSQTSGTSVTLSSASAQQPTFTAPTSETTLVFDLTVTDDDGATSTDSVTITVLPTIVLSNNAAGGTNGVAVTTGNSGGASGNAWQSVNGSAWTYSNTRAARGTLSYKCDQIASTAATLQWQMSALTEHYGRMYMYLTDILPVADPFVRAYASGFAEAFRIEVSSSGHLAVRDSSGTSLYTGTNTFAENTWYRVEWHAVSSTTVGQLQVRLYVADQSSPLETFTSSANLNIRAETSWVQFGPSFGLNPAPGSKWFDEMAIGSAGGGWIGSAAGTPINQAPVADAGADATVEPRTLHTLTGLATDDGSIANWQWQQISGPAVTLSSATAQNPTFTTPAVQGGATLVFGLTVTDDNGLDSAQDTVTITVLTPTLYYARGGTWSP